ncbi:MAG TPA: hypothetical protein VF017_11045 [Thermoanaerobaculia bacterium]|nr:hypothetical protein [Thermoanaerobaculia bacterium]
MTELYEGIIERALAVAKSFGRPEPAHEVERRALKLLEQPTEKRATLLANSAAYRTPQLAEWVIAESFRLRYEDPVHGVLLARLALEISESLPQGLHRPLVVDLCAKAHAYLGNAYRVVGDIPQAQTHIQLSQETLLDGSCDPLLTGEVASIAAALATELGDFDTAYQLLRGVWNTYCDLNEPALAGRCLVDLGRSMVSGGNHKIGRSVLVHALQLLQASPEPELLISAFHAMAYSLAEIGLLDEARYYALLSRPLYKLIPGDVPRQRFRWIEATLLEKAGLIEEARLLLAQTYEGFSWLGFDYDAALVSLDLSLVLLKQRKWAEVESLARESYAAFAARGLSDRATAALLLFVDAAKQRTLAEELVKRVAGEIRGGQREAWAAELASR